MKSGLQLQSTGSRRENLSLTLSLALAIPNPHDAFPYL